MKNSDVIISGMYRTMLPSQIILVLMTNLPAVIDIAVVGNMLNAECLAVLGILAPLITLIAGLSLMMAAGTRMVIGDYIGLGRIGSVKSIFMTSFSIACAMAALVTLAACVFTGPVLELDGIPDGYETMASGYFHVIAVGFLPFFINPLLVVLLSAGNHVSYCAMVTVVTSIVNVVVSVLFVMFVSDDLYYVGIAYVLSMYAGMAMLMLKLVFGTDTVAFGSKYFSTEALKGIIKNGLPQAVVSVFVSIRLAVMNSCALSTAGIAAVTGISVCTGAVFILNIFVRAPKESNRFIAGIAGHEQDTGGLCGIMKTDAAMIFPLVAGLAVLFGVFSSRIASFYGVTGDDLLYASLAISMYALAYVPEYIFTQLNSVYNSSLGRSGLSFVLNTVTVLAIPCGIMLCGRMMSDIYLIFAALPVSYMTGICLQFIISCIRNRRFSLKPPDVIWADKEFSGWPGKNMFACISDRAGISEVSRKTVGFCRENGISGRKAFFAGLCVEEMASDILLQGAGNSGMKKTVADVSVRIQNGGVQIRLRDNAPLCDRAGRIRNGTGLCAAIVSGTASEISCSQVLKTNNTYIRLKS